MYCYLYIPSKFENF
nr:unnamed protein product [Callosobruchus analis]